MILPPNVRTCVKVSGSRGAILGERVRGFNQENENSSKKTLSPKSVDIPVDSPLVDCEQCR